MEIGEVEPGYEELAELEDTSPCLGLVTRYSEPLRGSSHDMHRIPPKMSLPKATAVSAIPRNEAEAQLKPSRKTISLIQTPFSQPALRTSFEAALAQFARIPDDGVEVGDIEATILKLEGKYRKAPPVRNGGLETSPHVEDEELAELEDKSPCLTETSCTGANNQHRYQMLERHQQEVEVAACWDHDSSSAWGQGVLGLLGSISV